MTAAEPIASTSRSPEPFDFQTASSPWGGGGGPSTLSPDAAQLDPADFSLHGYSPLEFPLPAVRCQDCDRPVLQSAILNHAANCQKIRQLELAGAQGDEDDGRSLSVSLNPNKRRLSNASLSSASSPPQAKRSKYDPPSPVPSTARSLAAESDYGGSTSALEGLSKEEWAARRDYEKRLLKEAQRAEKKGERHGPLDLNRHCGVINAKGVPCSRALTCKSHSVGAKRDVPGRTKPYDLLFAEWNAIHKPHAVVKPKESKLRREVDKAPPSEAAPAPKTAADGAPAKKKKKKAGADGGGGKKGKNALTGSGSGASAQADASQSSTPVSELAWLISAAQTSRARLAAAPSRRLAAALTKTGSSAAPVPPATAISTALLAPPPTTNGARKPTAAQLRQMGSRILPREASKTLLYGRRRDESATLNGMLREALTGSG